MWTSDIPSIVLTKIKHGFSSKLKTKYPDINFTTSDSSKTTAKFPTVYVNKLSSPEQGQDLEGTEIHAILATFQIEVTDNVSQSRANEVIDEVMHIMKTMRFQIVGDPHTDNRDNAYRYVMRCRRMIGALDTL